MVTISLKISEIENIVYAIGLLEPIDTGGLALSYNKILIKLKKSFKTRINKAFVQSVIDAFVVRHKLKVSTYKKAR